MKDLNGNVGQEKIPLEKSMKSINGEEVKARKNYTIPDEKLDEG